MWVREIERTLKQLWGGDTEVNVGGGKRTLEVNVGGEGGLMEL